MQYCLTSSITQLFANGLNNFNQSRPLKSQGKQNDLIKLLDRLGKNPQLHLSLQDSSCLAGDRFIGNISIMTYEFRVSFDHSCVALLTSEMLPHAVIHSRVC